MTPRTLCRQIVFLVAFFAIIAQVTSLTIQNTGFSLASTTTGDTSAIINMPLTMNNGAADFPPSSGMTLNGAEIFKASVSMSYVPLISIPGQASLSGITFYLGANSMPANKVNPSDPVEVDYIFNSFSTGSLTDGTYDFYAKAFYGSSATVESDHYTVILARTPLAPTSLTVDGAPTASSIKLRWINQSTTADKFTIERKESSLSNYTALPLYEVPNATTYTDGTVAAGTSYDYRIQACRSGSGCSGHSNVITVSSAENCSLTVSLSPDTQAAQYVSPGQSEASLVKFNLFPNCAITLNSLSVSLNGYTNISSLHLYDSSTQVNAVSVAGASASFDGLNIQIPASLTRSIEIRGDINSSAMSGSMVSGSFGSFTATSASGSVGSSNTSVVVGNVMTVSGYAGDTIPPAIPTELAAPKNDYNEVDLSWAASTDNVGVAGYEVWRTNGTWIRLGNSPTTSYIDTTVASGTGYYYKIIAYDAAGNKSPEPSQSAWLFLNTPASTSLPLPPSYVTAESIVGKIVVSWPPAASATKYSIHRKIGTGTYQPLSSNITISYYDDVNVTTGSVYRYKVMGCDATACSTTGTESNSVTYNGGGASCTSLTSAINDADTSYVASEPVNFTWTCSPGGIASNVYMKLYRSDGTVVSSLNSPNNIGTQTLYLSTLNLSIGSYIVKACFESNCSTTATSQTFTVVSGT